jgi:hypothetical protein
MKFASFDIGTKNLGVYFEENDHTPYVYEVVCLCDSTTKSKYSYTILDNLSAYLEKHKEFLEQCDYIIIEKQLRVNKIAQRVEGHLISWLLITLKCGQKIKSISSKEKTRQFNAPLKMTKPQRKKWAVMFVKEMVFSNMHCDMLHLLETTKKADDICDAYLQCQAFKKIHKLNLC